MWLCAVQRAPQSLAQVRRSSAPEYTVRRCLNKAVPLCTTTTARVCCTWPASQASRRGYVLFARHIFQGVLLAVLLFATSFLLESSRSGTERRVLTRLRSTGLHLHATGEADLKREGKRFTENGRTIVVPIAPFTAAALRASLHPGVCGLERTTSPSESPDSAAGRGAEARGRSRQSRRARGRAQRTERSVCGLAHSTTSHGCHMGPRSVFLCFCLF